MLISIINMLRELFFLKKYKLQLIYKYFSNLIYTILNKFYNETQERKDCNQ